MLSPEQHHELPRSSGLFSPDEVVAERALNGADMRGASIQGTHFQGCDLSEVDFSGARLSNVRFENCLLKRALLRDTVIENAIFLESDLGQSTFVRARVSGGTFENCTLEGATIVQSGFDRTQISGIDMRRSRIADLRLQDCSLIASNLERVTAYSGTVLNCTLENTAASESAMWDFEFADTTFASVSFRLSDLSRSRFVRVNATGVNCQRASLNGCVLRSSMFPDCDFEFADFRSASMVGCDFSGANFCGADLSGADAVASTFSGADFYWADIEAFQRSGCRSDDVRWPELVRAAHGPKTYSFPKIPRKPLYKAFATEEERRLFVTGLGIANYWRKP